MYKTQWCVMHRILYITYFGLINADDIHQWMAEMRDLVASVDTPKIHLIINLMEMKVNDTPIDRFRKLLFSYEKTYRIGHIVLIARNSELYTMLKTTIGAYHIDTRLAASFDSAVNYLKSVDPSLCDVEWLAICDDD